MAHQNRLHLGRAEALARDLDRVVGPPEHVPEAVLRIDISPVAVHPDILEPAPVRVDVALAVTQKPRVMPGHGFRMTSSPTSPRTDRPSASSTSAAMPGKGPANEHARR